MWTCGGGGLRRRHETGMKVTTGGRFNIGHVRLLPRCPHVDKVLAIGWEKNPSPTRPGRSSPPSIRSERPPRRRGRWPSRRANMHDYGPRKDGARWLRERLHALNNPYAHLHRVDEGIPRPTGGPDRRFEQNQLLATPADDDMSPHRRRGGGTSQRGSEIRNPTLVQATPTPHPLRRRRDMAANRRRSPSLAGGLPHNTSSRSTSASSTAVLLRRARGSRISACGYGEGRLLWDGDDGRRTPINPRAGSEFQRHRGDGPDPGGRGGPAGHGAGGSAPGQPEGESGLLLGIRRLLLGGHHAPGQEEARLSQRRFSRDA